MRSELSFAKVWQEYTDGRSFNESIDLYDTVAQNENFYVGNQWEGVNAPNLEKPVMNIARRVVTYFVSSLVSDDISVRLQEFSEDPANKNVLAMVESQFAEIMELAGIKKRLRNVLRNAAVDGDGCMHYYFDPTAGPQPLAGEAMSQTPGRIEAEELDNTNVYFGNPQAHEVQEQPYILLVYRLRVKDVKERAEQNKQDPEGIEADSNDNDNTGRPEKDKVTVVRRYYKRGGTVWYMECTQGAMVTPETDTGLQHYPLAWLMWERVKDQYHGQAAMTGIIPNQIFINKLYAMAMHHVKMMAFPKIVYNARMIPDGWDSTVGAAIPTKGDPNQAVAASFRAADMSGQVLEMIQRVMTDTRDTMGASDAALGNVKPDNTSAIIATQKQTAMPLELQKMEFYQFVEDSVRIWLDMMGAYYGIRLVSLLMPDELTGQDAPQQVAFDFAQLQGMDLRLNVDIGASTYWSELMQVQTLDNLYSQKIIDDPELYLELMPAQYVPNKQRILEHLAKKRQSLEMGGQMDPGQPDPGAQMEMPMAPAEQSPAAEMMLPPEVMAALMGAGG